MEAIAGGIDVLALGEMGIGNTTIAAAIYHALYGGAAEDWVGRGTGVNDEGLKRKADAVRPRNRPASRPSRRSVRSAAPARRARNRGHGRRDPGGAHGAVPVMLDGYVVCAAAAILHAHRPRELDHCLAGHVSAEAAHAEVLERLGKKPLLDLGMRLGEGSGAALAIGIVKAALACHKRHGDIQFGRASTTRTREARLSFEGLIVSAPLPRRARRVAAFGSKRS